MCLINNHCRIGTQSGINHKLPQQHTIRHVLNNRTLRCVVFEPNGIPHLLAQLNIHLLCNSSGDRQCRNSSGLGASDLLVARGVPDFVEILGELGGFAGAGLADHDDDLVLVD